MIERHYAKYQRTAEHDAAEPLDTTAQYDNAKMSGAEGIRTLGQAAISKGFLDSIVLFRPT
jgi:hypothetical protein